MVKLGHNHKENSHIIYGSFFMLLNLYGNLVKSAKKNLNFLIIFFSLFIFGIILGAIFKSEIEKEFFYSN